MSSRHLMKLALLATASLCTATLGFTAQIVTNEDQKSIVENQLAKLRSTITPQAQDPLAKHMSNAGYLSASMSGTMMSGESVFYQITFSDGSTEATAYLSKAIDEDGYTVDMLTINGERVTEDGGQWLIGNYFEYDRPEEASVAIQELALSGQFTPLDAKPFEPGSLTGKMDGITVLALPNQDGIVFAANSGTEFSLIWLAQQKRPPTPKQRVCDHLFEVCTHGSTEAAIHACEVWLKYCAGGGANPG